MTQDEIDQFHGWLAEHPQYRKLLQPTSTRDHVYSVLGGAGAAIGAGANAAAHNRGVQFDADVERARLQQQAERVLQPVELALTSFFGVNIGLNRSELSTMLRLSKKTDYALLALQHLAMEAPSGVASTRAIAARFDIPLELLAKVLQQLARHGFVTAHKGVHGGYHLTRPARAISVAEVVQAIDGPMTFTVCSPTDVRCDQFATCTVRDPLWRVKDRIASVLQALSLADMTAGDNAGSIPVALGRRDDKTAAPVEAR